MLIGHVTFACGASTPNLQAIRKAKVAGPEPSGAVEPTPEVFGDHAKPDKT